MKYVRISDLPQHGQAGLTALTRAFEELAVAMALKQIHGAERGAQRYMEIGGFVRFDSEGELVVPLEE
jgi:hypothetical protein